MQVHGALGMSDDVPLAAQWRQALVKPADARHRVLVALERNRVVGFAIIGWFLKFVSTRGYGLFVWYRILLGLALYLLLGFGVITA